MVQCPLLLTMMITAMKVHILTLFPQSILEKMDVPACQEKAREQATTVYPHPSPSTSFHSY